MKNRRDRVRAEFQALQAQRGGSAKGQAVRHMTGDQAAALYHKLRGKLAVANGYWWDLGDVKEAARLFFRDPEAGCWYAVYWKPRLDPGQIPRFRRLTFEEFCELFRIEYAA